MDKISGRPLSDAKRAGCAYLSQRSKRDSYNLPLFHSGMSNIKTTIITKNNYSLCIIVALSELNDTILCLIKWLICN